MNMWPGIQITGLLFGSQKATAYQACPSVDAGMLVAAAAWCGCGSVVIPGIRWEPPLDLSSW